MNKKIVLILTITVLAVGVATVCIFMANSGRIRDGYFPRHLILRQSLWALVSCLVISEEEGLLKVPEADLGKNLNSESLRMRFQENQACEMFFMPITSTVEERDKLEKDYILFDETQEQYVDELGNPIYLVFFGDKRRSYGNRELNLLARRYHAAAWVVGKDGTNQYGRSNDGFFVGYMRNGEREYQRPESSWWNFWER